MNAPIPHRAARRSGVRALFDALGQALQWRLLLLWLLATLLPAVLATLPVWSFLQAQFGRSLHAGEIAAGRDVPLLIQGLMKLGEQMGLVVTGSLAATVLMLLLSPWLAGMVVASLRAGRRLGFGELIHGGLSEYGRLLRMLLWSAIPLGIALAIGAGVMGAAGKATEQAILSADVDRARHLALLAAAVVFVLLHASVEAGRGWLGADAQLRSVIRAWWRGLKLLLRRPLATLAVYLGTCVAGFGLAAVLAWLRVRVDAVGPVGFVVGLLLTQAMVAALGWSRIARLYGLSALAADALRAESAPPATAPATAAAATAA